VKLLITEQIIYLKLNNILQYYNECDMLALRKEIIINALIHFMSTLNVIQKILPLKII